MPDNPIYDGVCSFADNKLEVTDCRAYDHIGSDTKNDTGNKLEIDKIHSTCSSSDEVYNKTKTENPITNSDNATYDSLQV